MTNSSQSLSLLGIRTPKYRSDLPPVPDRMLHLPIDDRGFPVPWFVHKRDDGTYDFRVVRRGGVAEAWNKKSCWLCGYPLGVYKANVVGPMCGINRVTSEPPQHLECATFAAKACPFLTRPLAVRNERDLPTDRVAGVPVKRNPGVCMIWTTKHVQPFKVSNGWLFQLGDPTNWSFWREGRRATRAEIDESVRAGMPFLEEAAAKDGARGKAELAVMVTKFEAMLPEA